MDIVLRAAVVMVAVMAFAVGMGVVSAQISLWWLRREWKRHEE